MRNKDLIMLGIIIGIALFFLGAMITSTFQGSDENLLPYKVSSFLKLFGLGILTATLIVGGIVGNDLNKYFKYIILIIGLVLLLIFTIGAQFMKWDISASAFYSSWGISGGTAPMSSSAYESRPSTPGFELIFAVIAIISVIVISKFKRKR